MECPYCVQLAWIVYCNYMEVMNSILNLNTFAKTCLTLPLISCGLGLQSQYSDSLQTGRPRDRIPMGAGVTTTIHPYWP